MEDIWVPDACTLPTAERPVRLAEFDALFARAVRVARTDPTRARLVVDAAADLVRNLAAREAACCSFFTFAVDTDGSGLTTLTVDVPPAYVAVLDAMLARVA